MIARILKTKRGNRFENHFRDRFQDVSKNGILGRESGQDD